jgi:uncharacterized protein (DUF362 family)
MHKLTSNIVLIDGIVVMEEMCPLMGDPRALGLVIAIEDPLLVDIVALEMIGLKTRIYHILGWSPKK